MFDQKITQEMVISFHNMAWLVDRFARSWGQRVRRLKEKIDESKPIEDEFIYREVMNQANRVIVKGEEPDEATFKIHGVKIRKKIVHRKSEKYNGADVYIEVEDTKFALVQFKLASSTRFNFDESELKNLEKWCDICLVDSMRPIACPSFVWLIRNYGNGIEKHRILKVCQLRKILKNRSSAKIKEFDFHGITRDTFRELLAVCWEGAPYTRKLSTQDLLRYAESLNRLVVAFTVGS